MNISVVRQPPLAGGNLRFHLHPAYRLVAANRVRRLRRFLPRLDVVWSFDPNLFPNLKRFGARRTIFHAVDPLFYRRQFSAARSASLVIAVSDQIRDQLEHAGTRSYVIGHGVAEDFVIAADASPRERSRVAFGYSGNLLRPQIHHAALMRIVDQHPHVDFTFWGNYEVGKGNFWTGGVSQDAAKFVECLAGKPNVNLRGVVTTEQLAAEMQEMDGFLIAYRADGMETDNSNSHKILEYFSTGKVVVGNQLSQYRGCSDLINSPLRSAAEDFADTFGSTLTHLAEWNKPALQAARRRLAAQNTYAEHLREIVHLLE